MTVPVSADFVIVGGGSVGSSIAYHLARKRAGSVVLFEKEGIASGSTGRAAGLISQQWEDDFHLQLAKESVEFFEWVDREGRFGLRFRQTGYLHLLFSKGQVASAKQAQPLQRKLGIEVEVLGPEDATRLLPGLNPERVWGATNCARDGYTDPYLATNAMAELAKEAGAQVHVGTEVTGIDLEGDRIAAVRTSAGSVATRLVIDAAGPWAALVSRMAGVDIPVRPFRRQLWFTNDVPQLATDAPVLMDGANDFYFRREGDGVLMCFGNPNEPSGFGTDVDWSWAEHVAEYAMYRYRPFQEAQLVTAWAAPRDITPDHDAVLGRLPGVEGLIVAAGHSGHGFMLSPAVGRMLADYIVDGHCDPDFGHMTVARFAGQNWPLGRYVGNGLKR
jgi:sarcosine oxidase subunit beta